MIWGVVWALGLLISWQDEGIVISYWVESHSDDAWVFVSGVVAVSTLPLN